MTGKTNASGAGGGGEIISAVTSKNVGMLWAIGSGTTYTTLGGYQGTVDPICVYDETYVTYSNGVFTFVMEGNYRIHYFGRGGYNSSGTAIRLYFQFLPGKPGSTWPSSTTVANAGTSGYFDENFSVGDTLYAQTRNSSGANVHDFGFVIEYLDGAGTLPRALGVQF